MSGSPAIVVGEHGDGRPPPGGRRPRIPGAGGSLTKTYRGGLAGTSTTDILIALTPVAGSRGYVGLERFTGTLAGRAGTFVLQHDAMGDRGEEWMTWRILADSGTGALRGIRGEGRVRIEGGVHRYHLDYAFADD